MSSGAKRSGKRSGRRSAKRSGGKKSARQRRPSLPRTAASSGSKTASKPKTTDWVDSKMSLTDLQNVAKSKGIPFGGLTKHQLIRKINNYY